jgi:alkylation response protein AidB-like acyl-CoA dehydrogenase
MQFAFTPEQQAFQRRLCDFLTAEITPGVKKRHHDPDEFSGWDWDFYIAFRKKLAAQGYIGMAWPKEYGGQARDFFYQMILEEEMEYHGAPGLDRSVTYIPNSILASGSDEQKQFFLPKIAAGELQFFVGYTEPEAGSDLASLSTRAMADGDDLVVTGQKAFASEANHADYGWLAVRTDFDSPKHRGISLLIVDMKSPGITLGEFTTISGWKHSTVNFDNVRVPRQNLIGEMNRGWYYIMGALDYERAAQSNPGLPRRSFDRLVEYCKTTLRDGKPLVADPVVRCRLAELSAEVEGAKLMSYWVASMHSRGLRPQHETAMAAMVKRQAARAIDIYAMELLGPGGQLTRDEPQAPTDGDFLYDYLNNMYFHFAAGGFDVNRNIIALRGLDMPR